jgi:hypothetical protein
MLSDLMVRAFSRLGIGAGVGEIPGEYCPGRYSVHAGQTVKLMGVGQRLARGASHIGGVVVVSGSQALRDILTPVYAALDLEWDPTTAGAIEDLVPGTTLPETADAILSELAVSRDLVAGSFSPETLVMAREFAAEHIAPRDPRQETEDR